MWFMQNTEIDGHVTMTACCFYNETRYYSFIVHLYLQVFDYQ